MKDGGQAMPNALSQSVSAEKGFYVSRHESSVSSYEVELNSRRLHVAQTSKARCRGQSRQAATRKCWAERRTGRVPRTSRSSSKAARLLSPVSYGGGVSLVARALLAVSCLLERAYAVDCNNICKRRVDRGG